MNPRLFFLCVMVVSLILSIEEFLANRQILILSMFQRSPHLLIREDNYCNCNCSINHVSGPYIAPGPSKIQKLVPMSVLEKSLHLDSVSGLRYLDHSSLSRFYQCQPSKRSNFGSNVRWCSERTFRNQESPLVALVSFHGSGNTWMRYMLEQATGIFTGSIYCDSILKAVFPGESVASGNVMVIKTHHSDSTELPKDVQLATKQERYHKAIVLVRDPFDALVSEANRRWNSIKSENAHVGLANEANFISNSKWDTLVDYKGVIWGYLLHTWLSQNNVETYVVQYEKLLSNTREELTKVLDFLSIDISDQRMECVLENSEGLFKRTEHLNFNPYSKENTEILNRHLSGTLHLLAQHNITYSLR